ATKVEERNILVGCALRPARFNELSLRITDRRVQLHKVKYVPKIERHLRHHLCRDFAAEIGIVRLKKGRSFGDQDLFGRAYRQRNVLARRLADFKRESLLLESLKTRCVDCPDAGC